jgi:hypothetical protein
LAAAVQHLAGQASSRAAVVTRALTRERRREIAARDVAILASLGTDPYLDEFETIADENHSVDLA